MKNENRRITKQEIQKIYNIDRTTVEVWIKKHDFPMIIINSKSKFIRENDLILWENSMIMSNKFVDELNS